MDIKTSTDIEKDISILYRKKAQSLLDCTQTIHVVHVKIEELNKLLNSTQKKEECFNAFSIAALPYIEYLYNTLREKLNK